MKNEHIELLSLMVASYKEKANMLLRSDADYAEVCYIPKQDKEYGTYDGNYTNRYRILTGIQFSEDKAHYEELIRYLLAEEIKDRETNSFQGIGDALNLGVWLIKQFHREKDAALFLRAKNANFDTSCGFDADAINENFFKTNIYDLDIDECIWLSLDLQEYDYGDKLIELWKSKQSEWNEENIGQLRSFERQRKNADGELIALLVLFKLKKDNLSDWDFCSISNDIAKKQIELNRIKDAFDTISEMLPKLMKINDWQDVGLGRFIMETCMDIIILGDKEVASHIWSQMKVHAAKMKNMHWNLYEKASKAAELMDDVKLSKSFKKRLEKEKKKL